MKALQRESLWRELLGKGLVQGELPLPGDPRPAWYIRAMLIVSGWLGALFLFAFVGVFFAIVAESAVASLIFGGLILLGSRWLMTMKHGGDFMEQFALAAALAGQALLMFGLFRLVGSNDILRWSLLAVVEVTLIAWLPGYLHRIFCTLATTTAVTLTLHELGGVSLSTGLVALTFAAVWLRELRWQGKRDSAWEAVGVGTAMALAVWDVPRILSGATQSWAVPWSAGGVMFQLGLIVQVAVWLFICVTVMKRAGADLNGNRARATLGLLAVMGTLAWLAPGLLPALMVLSIGFASGQRFLLGLGLVGLICFLSGYYYNLEQTLLVKSAVLAVTGSLLLLIRRVLTWLGEDHVA
jgi:hypothetical protein